MYFVANSWTNCVVVCVWSAIALSATILLIIKHQSIQAMNPQNINCFSLNIKIYQKKD